MVIENFAPAFGPDDGRRRRGLSAHDGPLVKDCGKILSDFLGPFPLPPRHPLAAARFGLLALLPARTLARTFFRGPRARAVFAGMAAHSMLPLDWPATASFGLMLAVLAHAVGWPLARGGSQAIVSAMGEYFETLGGQITTGLEVSSLEMLPEAQNVLFDLTPRQILQITGERLPPGYRRALSRYRYGQGVFKLDYALDGPVPWTAKECGLAGTVHLGGTSDEIYEAEASVWRGEHPRRPFVLLSQPSLFDETRAPRGKHTLWAYCHVPHGSTVDMSQAVEDQIERFAPGFRGRILARHSLNSAEMELYNPNYIGGDINGGAQTLTQFFTRPVPRWSPYSTPDRRLFICSSSTPPGGGVHGMCGYHAAKAVLRGTG